MIQCIKPAGEYDFKADPLFGLLCILTDHRDMTFTTMRTVFVQKTKLTTLFTKQHILWSQRHMIMGKLYLIITN